MTQTNALMVIDPQKSIEDASNRRSIVVTLREKNILRKDVDYGIVPGSAKPTLLKPGAERLCAAFGFNPQFEILDKIERWEADSPLFFYQVVCHLIHIESSLEVATGIGSCNSMESKYRWRWVDASDVPPQLDKSALVSRGGTISEFEFAIDKAETGGKYGKPASYWQAFKDAIANGTARKSKRKTNAGKELDGWEIGGLSYRIPNDDVFSLVNTVVKMACKRALVAAALIGANASEFFTQDIEDMPGFGVISPDTDVIEGQFTEITEVTKTPAEPSASVRGAGIPAASKPPEPPKQEQADMRQRPDESEADANFYSIDKLIINRTESALQYVLSVHKSQTRIPLSNPGMLEDKLVDGVSALALEAKIYKLTPMWSVQADHDAEGWNVQSIETTIPVTA